MGSAAGWVLGCGGVLMASLLAASRIDTRGESAMFVALMAIGSLAYVCALIGVSRGIESRRLLLACLLLAVAWRVAIVPAAPLVSDDVYRYVWDGRVQRFGFNPYRSAPDEPALEHLHVEATRRIDPTSAALPAIYPPAAELFFRGVTAVHESVTAIVIAVVVCDVLTMLVLWRWARNKPGGVRGGSSPTRGIRWSRSKGRAAVISMSWGRSSWSWPALRSRVVVACSRRRP